MGVDASSAVVTRWKAGQRCAGGWLSVAETFAFLTEE